MAQVPSGRRAHWRAEQNALDSVGGNAAILPPGTIYVPDRTGAGYAFQMNSQGAFVNQVGGSLDLRRFTLSVWVNAAFPHFGYVLTKGAPGKANFELYFANSDGPTPFVPSISF